MAAFNYQVVVPSIDELEVKEDVECSFDGCSRVFKSSASLSMHIVRHHQGKSLESTDNSPKLYYCPVEGCSRSKESNQKPFKKLGQVKQHYNLMHKEKKYICEKCQRKFSMRDTWRRHVKECGTIFKCDSCSVEVKSSNALYQHCKRTGHPLNNQKVKPKQTPVIIAPLIIKTVLPLPKDSKDGLTDSNMTPSTTIQPTTELNDDSSHSESVELATQTDSIGIEPFHYTPPSLQDNKITQTNTLDLCEFGTQTMPLLGSYSWPKLHPQDINEILQTIDFGTQTTQHASNTDIEEQLLYNSLSDDNSQLIYKDQSSQT